MSMRCTSSFLFISMMLAPLGYSRSQTEPIRNERVAVVDVTIGPGETATWRGTNPTVAVYFTDATLEFRREGGARTGATFRRGEAVFEKAQPSTVKNVGSAAVRVARIELLGKGMRETWGMTGISPKYKLLFENDYARVYDIRIPAGTTEPQHTHHDRVVVCLSGGQAVHILPDGHEEPSTLKTGELAWRRGATHIGQNRGKTDLWVIAVEPK